MEGQTSGQSHRPMYWVAQLKASKQTFHKNIFQQGLVSFIISLLFFNGQIFDIQCRRTSASQAVSAVLPLATDRPRILNFQMVKVSRPETLHTRQQRSCQPQLQSRRRNLFLSRPVHCQLNWSNNASELRDMYPTCGHQLKSSAKSLISSLCPGVHN